MLVALQVLVAVVGFSLPRSPSPPGVGGAARYVPVLLAQWTTLVYVCRVGRPASALRPMLGRAWTSVGQAAVDLALALCAFAAIVACESAWVAHAAVGSAPVVTALLPHGPTELALWVVVAASVGFCEEVVFRSYLLTQFEALTGSAAWAVALQAALFGLAHGEQGVAVVVRFAVYGAGLGLLARSRRRLAPAIACHVALDLASGALGR